VRLGEDDLQNVWVPDTFFRNEKRATFHEVTVSDAASRYHYSSRKKRATFHEVTVSDADLCYHYCSHEKRATFHEVTVSDAASRYHYCSHEKMSHLPRGDRQRCGLMHHYCSHEKRATFHEVTVSIVSALMRPGAPISVATCHEVTVSNQLMRLNATGHVWYVVK